MTEAALFQPPFMVEAVFPVAEAVFPLAVAVFPVAVAVFLVVILVVGLWVVVTKHLFSKKFLSDKIY